MPKRLKGKYGDLETRLSLHFVDSSDPRKPKLVPIWNWLPLFGGALGGYTAGSGLTHGNYFLLGIGILIGFSLAYFFRLRSIAIEEASEYAILDILMDYEKRMMKIEEELAEEARAHGLDPAERIAQFREERKEQEEEVFGEWRTKFPRRKGWIF